jgi:hypothetical protein
MPSQVISQVEITDAAWAATPTIPLNTGLVAIIGARGSGKTAVADMIAAGCDAASWTDRDGDDAVSPSLLVRAQPVIGNAKVTLSWGGGNKVTCALDGRDADEPLTFPRARYLSQQFVEDLCSSKGASEGLIREVERVIFEAHTEEDRDGATSFTELLDFKITRFQQSRVREDDAIASISDRIAEEMEKEGLVAVYDQQVIQKKQLIAGYNADLRKVVVKGTETQANRHAELSRAAEAHNAKIQAFNNQRRAFLTM